MTQLTDVDARARIEAELAALGEVPLDSGQGEQEAQGSALGPADDIASFDFDLDPSSGAAAPSMELQTGAELVARISQLMGQLPPQRDSQSFAASMDPSRVPIGTRHAPPGEVVLELLGNPIVPLSQLSVDSIEAQVLGRIGRLAPPAAPRLRVISAAADSRRTQSDLGPVRAPASSSARVIALVAVTLALAAGTVLVIRALDPSRDPSRSPSANHSPMASRNPSGTNLAATLAAQRDRLAQRQDLATMSQSASVALLGLGIDRKATAARSSQRIAAMEEAYALALKGEESLVPGVGPGALGGSEGAALVDEDGAGGERG